MSGQNMNKFMMIAYLILIASCAGDSVESDSYEAEEIKISYLPSGAYGSCIGECPTQNMCSFANGFGPIGIFTIVEKRETQEDCSNPLSIPSQGVVLRQDYSIVGEKFEEDIFIVEPYGFNIGNAPEGSQWLVSIHEQDGHFLSESWKSLELRSQEGSESSDSEFPSDLKDLQKEMAALRQRFENRSECLGSFSSKEEKDESYREGFKEQCL